MTEAPEDPALHAAIEALLIERGPLTVTELVNAVRGSGFDLGYDPEETVLDTLYASFGSLFDELDDRWAHLPSLLHNRVFTHRLTGPEVDRDQLRVSPDLLAILWLEDADLLQLADGTELSLADGSVGLPAGTLAGLEAHLGDLVSVTVTDRGIELARVDHEVHADLGDAVSRLVEIASTGRPIELETAFLTLCADLDDAFRSPCPPFAHLLADAGLAMHGDWVASPGFDFAASRAKARATTLADEYGVTPDQAAAIAAMMTMHREVLSVFVAAQQAQTQDGQLDPDAFGASVASVGASAPGIDANVGSKLHHIAAPEVAESFLTESQNWEHPLSDEALVKMLSIVEEQASRAVRPALRWLRAMVYERLGQISLAEETLLAAERLDPTWPLTLLDLARYASDRGDSSRALALLARADPYEEPGLVELLQAFGPVSGPTVGRNDPCWCGSGRKFKQCHLHRPAAQPLEERAAWLYQKAGTFPRTSAWRSLVSVLAQARAAYAETAAEINAAIEDPVVADVALFEGGAFATFVEQRGFLLPDDERLLAETWLRVERSVFDITDVQREKGFTVRDVRTGAVHDVRERAGSRHVKAGQLICARVVPAGETWQIFGGTEPVTLHDRETLMSLLDGEPDPLLLMTFLAHRDAPPTLVTPDGDPLVLAEAVLEVSDAEAVSAALDLAYAPVEGSDPPEWHDTQAISGMERIRATLRLTGAELTINATSNRRMDDVLKVIRELDPGAVVRTEDRKPVPDTRAAQQLFVKNPAKESLFLTPENAPPDVQEAMASYIEKYEREWLDLPIPALQDLTPRQAADDPTRRDDLVRLLASFGDADGPTDMSARRLRKALGLSEE